MKFISFISFLLLACQQQVSSIEEGSYTSTSSFTIPSDPSGMHWNPTEEILYILSGTQTNGEHYLYAYTEDGTLRCSMTIPQSVGMSRVDGFYISSDNSLAYIVDSQGPYYAGTTGSLGGSLYEMTWDDPCSCMMGDCAEDSVTWTPTLSRQWSLSSSDLGDGGSFFRNSGVIIKDDTFFAVNGLHPSLDTFPKSIVQVDMETSAILNQWSFTESIYDLEGLACGEDSCEDYIYIGDEHNIIYKMDLTDNGALVQSWDIGSLAGSTYTDKGIEALGYANGNFYAGIQNTKIIFVLQLSTDSDTTDDSTPDKCFSGETKVTVEGKGAVSMKDLVIGDMVQVAPNSYEPVYSFIKKNHKGESTFLQIHTEHSTNPLELTSHHFLFVDNVGVVPASEVSIGSVLHVVMDDGDVILTKVTKIRSVKRKGAYAPVTYSGQIVVNDVLCSVFAYRQESGTNTLMFGGYDSGINLNNFFRWSEAPRRLLCKLRFDTCMEESYDELIGLRTNMIEKVFFEWWINLNLVFGSLIFVVVMVGITMMNAMEFLIDYPSMTLMLGCFAFYVQNHRKGVTRK